ncbi:hypothetical protein F1880_008001 [Penicillium rolfsii]|nr:hypothetical protein F1880_008001 [Penicillium rolfsii]
MQILRAGRLCRQGNWTSVNFRPQHMFERDYGVLSNHWRPAGDAVNANPEATSARTDDADRMA